MLSLAAKKGKLLDPPVSALTQKDSISWVYHVRGIAIMLIVYRHIVLGMKFSGVEVSPFMYNFQMFFFNFRMPAFFILSGIFIMKSLQKRQEWSIARNKVATLLYPYLLWACITLLLQIMFRQFSNAQRHWEDFQFILTQPRALDQLWYLMALFNVSILFLVLNRFLAKRVWLHGLFAAALHFLAGYLLEYSFFSDFFNFYIYFFIGTLLSSLLLNKEQSTRILDPKYLKFIVPLFLLGQWFWFVHNPESKGVHKVATGYELLFLLINFLGCYVLFVFSSVISKTTRSEWLAYIGKHSLYIYILHVQLAAIVRKVVRDIYPAVDPWVLLGICFACGIFLPIFFITNFRRFGAERLFTLPTRKS